jgi:hypothetical protein
MNNIVVSPSRRYVAICNKSDFSGHYFRSFTLPASVEANNSDIAAHYFLNFMNYSACIERCVTEEDFNNVQEETSMAEDALAAA